MKSAASQRRARSKSVNALVRLMVVVLMVAGCGGSGIQAFQSLKENPMAQPTLSFASPTRVSGGPGGGLGIQSPGTITTRFDIEPEQVELAAAELFAQASAAGYEPLEPINPRNDPSVIAHRSERGRLPSVSFGARVRDDGTATAYVTLDS